MSLRHHILIYGSYPPPFGGVPRHLEELAALMAERGWGVHVVAGGHSGAFRKDGVTIYKEPRSTKARRALLSVAHLADWLAGERLLIEQSFADRVQFVSWVSLGREIIHCHGVDVIGVYNVLRLPAALHLSEQYGIPLVISCFGEAYSHTATLMRRRSVVERGLAHAAALWSMTKHCATGYQKLGLSPEVRVTPIGVDTRTFSPLRNSEAARQRLGLVANDLVVLFVGRMIREMGLHTLVEILPGLLAHTPRLRVVIAGARGNMTAELERMVAATAGRMRVLPNVSAEELPDIYAVADVVVAPTQGDRACGSLASLEGMASGKPVIAARVGGVPEIVGVGDSGILIPAEDGAALAGAINGLLADPERREAMGRAARRRVEDCFDRDVLNGDIERLYAAIVERRSVASAAST